MQQTSHVCAVVVCFLAAAFGTLSHERRTTPALELLNTARLADARASEQGFEIHAVIKLGQEKAAEAEGTYLLVWASPTRWREEFSVSHFHQVRVSLPEGFGKKENLTFCRCVCGSLCRLSISMVVWSFGEKNQQARLNGTKKKVQSCVVSKYQRTPLP